MYNYSTKQLLRCRYEKRTFYQQFCVEKSIEFSDHSQTHPAIVCSEGSEGEKTQYLAGIREVIADVPLNLRLNKLPSMRVRSGCTAISKEHPILVEKKEEIGALNLRKSSVYA